MMGGCSRAKALEPEVAKVLGIGTCRDVGGVIRIPTEEATLTTPMTTARTTQVEVVPLVGEDMAVVEEDEATTGIVIETVIDVAEPTKIPAKTTPQNGMKFIRIYISEWKTSRKLRINTGGN